MAPRLDFYLLKALSILSGKIRLEYGFSILGAMADTKIADFGAVCMHVTSLHSY